MENPVILHSTSLKDFRIIIGDLIEEKLKQIKPAEPLQTKPDSEYLSRREVCALLKISLSTLHYYTKYGTIKGYRIGGRILFKAAEVNNSVQEIQSTKYKRKL